MNLNARTYDTCKRCGRFGRVASHKCPPAWKCWNPEHGDEDSARTIYASDAEDAAEEWAERDDCDSADYSIVAGSPVVVHVRGKGGTLARFEVSGESVPQYSAREIEPEAVPK